MGRVESEYKRRARKGEVQKILLDVVKSAGVISIALVAPNAIGAMAKLGLIETPRRRELIGRSLESLCRRGLLRRDRGRLALAALGQRALAQLQLRTFSPVASRRWDRKWRVLAFDIPERRRTLRDFVRRTLLSNGFERLQDSVWVYPYDCEDWVGLWKAELRLGKEMLYLIVDSIEGEAVLRRRFHL